MGGEKNNQLLKNFPVYESFQCPLKSYRRIGTGEALNSLQCHGSGRTLRHVSEGNFGLHC